VDERDEVETSKEAIPRANLPSLQASHVSLSEKLTKKKYRLECSFTKRKSTSYGFGFICK
jgi:hypothetical protein